MNIGEKIIELRKKDNLTQEKLAEKIGVSRQTLSNWENNITSPDLNQAKNIVKIFKISLDDLIDNKTEIECSGKKGILTKIIGKTCYLDEDLEDYRISYNTPCKVLDVNNKFIKIEFKSGKDIITKLVSMKLISSIEFIEEEEE